MYIKVIAVNEMGESTASVESYYMITLREAPSGKPTITEAGNSSATSIFIRWQPPHKVINCRDDVIKHLC